MIDPSDELLSPEGHQIAERQFHEFEKAKAKTVAEHEVAANRWLREWHVKNNIHRQWEFSDEGYESMDDEQ